MWKSTTTASRSVYGANDMASRMPQFLVFRIGRRGQIPVALPLVMLAPALWVGLWIASEAKAYQNGSGLYYPDLLADVVRSASGLEIDVTDEDNRRVFIALR